MNNDDFISIKKAATLCGVTPRTLARWVDAGKISAVFTSGGHRRIRREDVFAFLSSRRSLRAQSTRGLIRVVVVGVRDDAIRMLRRSVLDLGMTLRLEHAWSTLEVGLWVGDLRPQLVLIDSDHVRDAEALAGALRSSAQAVDSRVVLTDARKRQDPLVFQDLVSTLHFE